MEPCGALGRNKRSPINFGESRVKHLAQPHVSFDVACLCRLMNFLLFRCQREFHQFVLFAKCWPLFSRRVYLAKNASARLLDASSPVW